jgi:endonuclease/exonuclease/phosphatase family metal-dependent hydrolase
VLLALVVLLLGCAALRLVAILYRLPWLAHDFLVYFPTLGYAIAGICLAAPCLRVKAVPRLLVAITLLIVLANVCADFRLPWRDAEVSSGDRQLELLTYNIHEAAWADDEIVRFVEERRPDIVCLQEVPPEFWQRHEARLRQSFRHVAYQNYLLVATNLEVTRTEKFDLFQGRKLLHLVLDLGNGRLDVFTTHLSVAKPHNFFPRLDAQRQQTEQILEELAALPGPFVIAGDFNFPLHSTCYQRVTARYQNARAAVGEGVGYTFTTYLPLTTIDHCFASEDVQFTRAEPLPVRWSDHLPVRVSFVIQR